MSQTPNSAELKSLPKYCKQKTGQGSDGTDYSKIFGECWEDMHHFCFGLNLLNRAAKEFKDPNARAWYLNEGIGNIEYVNRSRYVASCDKIRHELNFFEGRGYELKKDSANAIKRYQKAIELQPKYINPYLALANLFKKNNDVNSAREIIQKGLKVQPNAQALQNARRNLNKN